MDEWENNATEPVVLNGSNELVEAEKSPFSLALKIVFLNVCWGIVIALFSGFFESWNVIFSFRDFQPTSISLAHWLVDVVITILPPSIWAYSNPCLYNSCSNTGFSGIFLVGLYILPVCTFLSPLIMIFVLNKALILERQYSSSHLVQVWISLIVSVFLVVSALSFIPLSAILHVLFPSNSDTITTISILASFILTGAIYVFRKEIFSSWYWAVRIIALFIYGMTILVMIFFAGISFWQMNWVIPGFISQIKSVYPESSQESFSETYLYGDPLGPFQLRTQTEGWSKDNDQVFFDLRQFKKESLNVSAPCMNFIQTNSYFDDVTMHTCQCKRAKEVFSCSYSYYDIYSGFWVSAGESQIKIIPNGNFVTLIERTVKSSE